VSRSNVAAPTIFQFLAPPLTTSGSDMCIKQCAVRTGLCLFTSFDLFIYVYLGSSQIATIYENKKMYSLMSINNCYCLRDGMASSVGSEANSQRDLMEYKCTATIAGACVCVCVCTTASIDRFISRRNGYQC
jgi:hypothetical protein